MKEKLDAFTAAYVECAVWTFDSDSEKRFDAADLSDEAVSRIVDECKTFRTYVRAQLGDEAASVVDCAHGGHGFWLTRNGHGTGFWDGDWKELGEPLTAAAKAFGQSDLYEDCGILHLA